MVVQVRTVLINVAFIGNSIIEGCWVGRLGTRCDPLDGIIRPPDAIRDHPEVDDGGEIAVAFRHFGAGGSIAHNGDLVAELEQIVEMRLGT